MLRHDAAAGARLVAGLAGLASIGVASEIASRDTPAAAAHKHKSRRGAATLQRTHIAALRSDGFVIVDGAIPLRTLALARADARALDARLSPTDQHSAEIRSDRVCWVDGDDGAGIGAALDLLRALPLELCAGDRWAGFAASAARPAGELGVPRAGQLAVYAAEADDDDDVAAATGGARYAAHRDGFDVGPLHPQACVLPGACMREVTAILYIGDAAGGELLLHLGAAPTDTTGASAARVVRVAPEGGRLVLFDSRRVLHEVRPNASASDRLALTVWIGGTATVGGFLRHCRDYLGWLAAVT